MKIQTCCDCEGSGECPYCIIDGTMVQEHCEYCKSSGKCTLCSGEGERPVMASADAMKVLPFLAFMNFAPRD